MSDSEEGYSTNGDDDVRRSRRVHVPSKRAQASAEQNSRRRKRTKDATPVDDDADGKAGSGDEAPPPASGSAASAASQSGPSSSSATASSSTTAESKKIAAFNKRFSVDDHSTEEVLALQMRTWTSDAYAHFESPPTIVTTPAGIVRYHFICKARPSVFVARARHDEATSNLRRHVERCTPADTPEVRTMAAYAHGSLYNRYRLRVRVAIWVARRARPYAIITDEELVDILRDLNANVVVPSRFTVSRDVIEIHGMTKLVVIERLSKVVGKIHVMADGWTSPNTISFVGIVVQFVEGGKVHVLSLDFVKLTKAHTGRYLAARLAECLQAFRIDQKVLGFTGDNASNNDTLVEELAIILPAFRGSDFQVRCFCHVLNLVAKAILSAFACELTGEGSAELEALNDEPTADEYTAPSPDDLAPDVIQSDAAAVESIIEEADLDGRVPALTSSASRVARMSITKLRKLATKVAHSPLLIDALNRACKQVGIDPILLQVDVSTRWNSTSNLATRGIRLRPALDRVTVMDEFNKSSGVRLRRFHMDSDEWKILEQLEPMLNVITFATTQVSKSAVPLVHEIIPIIDCITAYFDKTLDNPANHLAVRHAALRGLLMMNKYYARTDDCRVYRIALMLHPEYKMAYFTKAKWEQEWIDEARRIITDEWETHYRPAVQAAAAAAATTASTSSATSTDRFADARDHFNLFLAHTDTTMDPLDEWFSTPPLAMGGKLDPIRYWTDALAANHPLAQMALDFLSVPATSTDVERAFSKGGLTVSKLRHALSDESTRCATGLGMWAAVPGLIPFDAAVAAFKEKSRRSDKGKGKAIEGSQDVIDIS